MSKIYVPIGEYRVGHSDDVLHALLGSCVGVAILCAKKNVYGLAHCLLPSAECGQSSGDSRYVDRAIYALLDEMKLLEHEYKYVNAVIAGGGNMTMPESTDSNKLIGDANVREAEACLKKLGIHISYKDTLGMEGRKMIVYGLDNSCEIQMISRNSAS